MKNKYFSALCILLLATVVSVDCSKKSTVESVVTNRVSILVTDEKNNPVPDAEVTTNPATTILVTDNEGKAEFTDIPGRSYNVIVNKSGCPEFNQFVNLNGTNEANLHFIIISKLTIYIKDEQNRPIVGASLTTLPETQSVFTDNTGMTVLADVPIQPYLFTVTPKDLPPVKRNVVLDESTQDFIDFNITSEPPVMQITEPPDETVSTPFEIAFEGAGIDNEDGVLPDSTLTWRSNIDGELGTGGKITVAELSRGNHIITLEGTDSDNKTGETQIIIVTVDYDPDSYFPILESSEWLYRHQTPNFYVITTGNVSEYWEIKDMSILIDDENRRISTVYYDISIGVVVKQFKYILIDYFETDNGNLYITKTTEMIREWQDDDESNPYSILDIETTYTPRYLALKNLTDPSSEPHYESTVRAETEWLYTYYNTNSPVFRESVNLTTTVDVGEMKFISTDIRFFNAVKISFSALDSEKHWWLTRGLGLVQLEYNLSDTEQSAVLADSDILRFYREPPAKPAFTISPGNINTAPPAVPLTLSRETTEGMIELRNYLKRMLP